MKTLRLEKLGNDRCVIWWLDPATGDKAGPEGGKDHSGYTKEGLRERLAEMGMEAHHIEDCIRQMFLEPERTNPSHQEDR